MADGSLVIERFKAERNRKEGSASLDISSDCAIASLKSHGKIRKEKSYAGKRGKSHGDTPYGKPKATQNLKMARLAESNLLECASVETSSIMAGEASLNLPLPNQRGHSTGTVVALLGPRRSEISGNGSGS